jgi:Mg/Co/Ni transporter MgtE
MDIKLSTPYSKLLTLHPSDLADIIEDLDKKSQAAIFASLDEEKAADVLEELEIEAQINVLNSLTVEKAADVLEKMPADEAADILDDIKEETAEEILKEMDKEVSEEVKELMEYPEGTVGSLMATDLFHFNKDLRIAETIDELRRIQPQEETIYYLYVTDKKQKLCGVVSLWKLIISAPDKTLEEIMDRNIIYVKDTDDINDMINIISKYNLLSIPVVDEEGLLTGNVIVNDVVYELLKPKRRRG